MGSVTKVAFFSRRVALLIALVSVSGCSGIFLDVLVNDTYKRFYDALGEKNATIVYQELIGILAANFILATNSSALGFLSDLLDLDLRKRLSLGLFNQAKDRSHKADLRFSDQRIAEDIELFTSRFAVIGMTFVFMLLKASIFFLILWELSPPIRIFGTSISGSVAILSFAYFLIPTTVSYFLGVKMIRYEDKKRKAEARMRYALITALQKSDLRAEKKFGRALEQIVTTTFLSVQLTFLATFSNLSLSSISFLVPMFTLLPFYLRSDIPLGDLIKAAGAFSIFQISLSYIHNHFREVVRLVAAFNRLDQFSEALKLQGSDAACSDG